MKKKLFFLLGLLISLGSCEKNDFMLENQTPKNEDFTSMTRSFVEDPLVQIAGMPVHVKLVSNGKLLSAQSKGNVVVLNNGDDNSMRQRWYVKTTYSGLNLCLVGGNGSYIGGQLVPGPTGRAELSKAGLDTPGLSINISRQPSYYSIMGPIMSSSSPFPGLQRAPLHPENSGSNNLIFSGNSAADDSYLWDIIPIDDFKIEDIKYELTASDNFEMSEPMVIASQSVVNKSDKPVTKVFSFQENISSTSTFSETQGLRTTTTNSTTMPVQVPKMGEGTINTTVSSEQTWSYTTGETKTQSGVLTSSISQEVPPHSEYVAKLFAVHYKATVTYIIQLRGITSHKVIYLKGKWTGTTIYDATIEVFGEEGNLVQSKKVDMVLN